MHVGGYHAAYGKQPMAKSLTEWLASNFSLQYNLWIKLSPREQRIWSLPRGAPDRLKISPC